jgi:hypothetical protein
MLKTLQVVLHQLVGGSVGQRELTRCVNESASNPRKSPLSPASYSLRDGISRAGSVLKRCEARDSSARNSTVEERRVAPRVVDRIPRPRKKWPI